MDNVCIVSAMLVSQTYSMLSLILDMKAFLKNILYSLQGLHLGLICLRDARRTCHELMW